MSDKLTPEQVAEYVANGGENCPYCGSKEIVAVDILSGDSDGVFQEVACDDCGARWTDGYTLDRIGCNRMGSFEFVSASEPEKSEPPTPSNEKNLIIEIRGGIICSIHTDIPSYIDFTTLFMDRDNEKVDEDAALINEALEARTESNTYRKIY